MDASQWPQGMELVKPMEEFAASSNITTTTNSSIATRAQGVERRSRPNKEQALNCPRCNSTNTKFCYYNNYSLTQPRYFCKTCRRYWTEGGSLRNVPVGGGSRKNKRSSSSIISSSAAAAATSSSTATAAVATTASTSKELHLDEGHFIPPYKIPKFQYEGQDLNLAFPQQGIPDQYSSYPNNAAVGAFSSMGLLNRPFMPLPEYATGFGMLQELRPPTLNFPVGHGIVGGGEGGSGSGNTGKMLFPMEELKPVVPTGNETAEHFEQSKGQGGGDPPGYWNGISW